MMGSQQSGQMMGSQMMSQEMMRGKSGMMSQMNEMSGTMQQGADMDHTKMMNLSKMMDAMSVNMKAGDVSGRRSGRKTQGSHGAGGRWRYEMRALHQGIYENGVTGRRDAGRAAGVSECRDDRRRLSRRTMGIEGL